MSTIDYTISKVIYRLNYDGEKEYVATIYVENFREWLEKHGIAEESYVIENVYHTHYIEED